MYNELLAVNADDLALGILVAATDNLHLIGLTDRQRADVVLLPQILGNGGAHQSAASARGSTKVSLARLPAGGANV